MIFRSDHFRLHYYASFIPLLRSAKSNISFSDVWKVYFWWIYVMYVEKHIFFQNVQYTNATASFPLSCWSRQTLKLQKDKSQRRNEFSSVTVALCQPPWRGQSWVTRCPPPGTALSQTTPSPTVMSTALTENVTTLTVTPVILSSTTPGCSTFNVSTCEPCAPGSQYDNSESQIHHITLYAMFGFIHII